MSSAQGAVKEDHHGTHLLFRLYRYDDVPRRLQFDEYVWGVKIKAPIHGGGDITHWFTQCRVLE